MTPERTARLIGRQVLRLAVTLVVLTLAVGGLVAWYSYGHAAETKHISDYHSASGEMCGRVNDEAHRVAVTCAHGGEFSGSASSEVERVQASLYLLRSAVAGIAAIQERFRGASFEGPLERLQSAESRLGSAQELLGVGDEEMQRRTRSVLDRAAQLQRLHVAFSRGARKRMEATDRRQRFWMFGAGLALLSACVFGSRRYLASIRGVVADREEAQREVERALAERGEMERQVQHAQKLKSLGVLAGGIAHDFNNLLVGILGNAGLVRTSLQPGSKNAVRLDRTIHSAERAAELCSQLLAYSGRGHFTIEPLDLSRMIAEVAPLLRASVDKRATVSYHLADGLPAVEADSTQLRQVAMNLIMNASDAVAESHGEVTVTTGRVYCDDADLAGTWTGNELPPDDYVFLEVADTGCGIPAEDLPRIFDPFFTTKSDGRGLGLSATLGIVRSHGAALAVESEVGVGTKIRVLFPESDQTPSAEAAGPRESEVAHARGTVLVVDDEPAVRELVRDALEEAGLRVLTARDGRECVEAYRRAAGEIDLVLLDLTMPGMSGEGALRELRRIDPCVRVVLSSGYSEDEQGARFGDEPPAGFLAKPYTPDELLAEVLRAGLGDVGQRPRDAD